MADKYEHLTEAEREIRRLAELGTAPSPEEALTLLTEVSRLRGALAQLRMSHLVCEDPWYSCPKSSEGCANENAGSDCTCPAENHNAIIDAALAPNPAAAIEE